ncbi:MAG: PEP-CTERM sorting domain-containing protein [Planctomycetota bacterium]
MTLGSVTSRTGTTFGGANNAANYSGLLDDFFWGSEFVYEFTLADRGVLSISTTDDNGSPSGIDNDFILLNSLATGPNDSLTGPSPEATGDIGFVSQGDGSYGLLEAGTYFLSVDAFGVDAFSTSPGAYAFDLFFEEVVVPAAALAGLDGTVNAVLAAGEALFFEFDYDGISGGTIDTFGSDVTDTELALFDADGTLVLLNDNAGPIGTPEELQSELSLSGLDAGTYFLAAAGFNTTFADGFVVDSNSFASGGLTINGLSVAAIPEPGTVGLVGIAAFGGLFARRRRYRPK